MGYHYLLATGVALLLSYYGAAVRGRPSQPAQQKEAGLQPSYRCPSLAASLLDHWKNVTRLDARQPPSSTERDTASLLKQLGVAVMHDYCYFKLRFTGSAVEAADNLTEHCHYPSTAQAVVIRAEIYVQLFNQLLSTSERTGLSPFEFYIDLTSGTRNNVGLFKQLKLPVLSFSRHPNDRYTVPIPDIYMVIGVLGESFKFSENFPKLRNFATEMTEIYSLFRWKSPWEEKIPKVVFRGTCCATIASDDVSPQAREELRPSLCSNYHDNPLFDIGMKVNPARCGVPQPADSAFCAKCKLCQGRTRLSRFDQAKYKYQLIVDGEAATNDASVWKLLSKSAVIRLRPNGWHVPMFQQFYDPLLRPYEHYIPSDLDGLPSAVGWCEGNPGLCKGMASAGAQVLECLLHKEVLEGYIFGVFMYLHNSVHGVKHVDF